MPSTATGLERICNFVGKSNLHACLQNLGLLAFKIHSSYRSFDIHVSHLSFIHPLWIAFIFKPCSSPESLIEIESKQYHLQLTSMQSVAKTHACHWPHIKLFANSFRADTLFLASCYEGPLQGSKGLRGCDISHRGGAPGFLHLKDSSTITFADYVGNYTFTTLGEDKFAKFDPSIVLTEEHFDVFCMLMNLSVILMQAQSNLPSDLGMVSKNGRELEVQPEKCTFN